MPVFPAVNTFTGDVVRAVQTRIPTTSSLWATPFGRTWCDRARFDPPDITENSTNGTSWNTWGTSCAALFAGRTDVGINATSPNNYVRLTFNNGYAFAQLAAIVVAFAYQASAPTVTIKVESFDGATWTPRLDTTGTSMVGSSNWITAPLTDNSGDDGIRITILGTNTFTLTSIQLLSQRPGNQGGGEQSELPFSWDASKNLTISGTLGVTGVLTASGGVTGTASNASNLNSQAPSYYLARANHTGTQTASTISDLATTVQGYALSSFAAPSSDVSLNSHKITNLTDPTGAQDAATMTYVDSTAAALAIVFGA